ncbi:transcription factor BHLH062-like [Bidens hawaiensis]|uniref:transcription factor BHLH062-like n=1 Tax=Bidens hawaiensis TaxID=980011 RepID=UPI00404ADD0C
MKDSTHAHQNVDKTKKKSSGSKKNGAKSNRKINKAEREKLKRDHMNDLFLDLTNALESATHNSGKSSALTETIRIIGDLKAQVELLTKENSVLLSESQYIAVEKDELKEENRAIEAHIIKLQSQIDERLHVHPQSLWASECNPVFVLPLQNGPNLYKESKFHEPEANQLSPTVRKPHARYPSPSDSWPLNILSEQARAD